jgi:hypothetical protein
MGDANTPSVTLLAMSARDQKSFEDKQGGKATTALLDCVIGKTFVHDSTSWLDLTEIGKKVSDKIGKQVRQTPVVWGLNLATPSAFCKNPHYQAKIESTFQKWSPRSFIDAIDPLLKSHSDSPLELITDLERLTSGLLARAVDPEEAFRTAEVRATAVACLLQYCESSDRVSQYIFDVSQKTANDVEFAIRRACRALEENKFALLSNRGGGLADLFYLPIRITNILGWGGAAFHIKRLANREQSFDRDNFQHFVDLIIEHYSTSVVSMSDRQAPFVACALTAMKNLGLTNLGETVAGLLYSSAVECNGTIADAHLDSEKVLAFLLHRQSKQKASRNELLATPSELLTVLLKSATLFSLEDIFDWDMAALDHLTINAYIPETYRLFSQALMPGGINACFLIGTDIWRVAELEEAWSKVANVSPESNSVAMGAILSSMLFSDRVPWFLYSNSSAASPHSRTLPAI